MKTKMHNNSHLEMASTEPFICCRIKILAVLRQGLTDRISPV